MVRLNESLFFIEGQDEMLPDAHVYLLGHPESHDLSLVDAGLMGKGEYKIQSIVEEGINLSDIKRVILTHTHIDHIGCLPELIERIPSLELWVHAKEAQPLENGDERSVYGMEAFKDMCQAQYRLKDGAFKFKVDKWLEDNQELNIGGETWTVLHIPGHSLGGIALYRAADAILIPGDVVYADYAIGRFDLHGASGPQLSQSLMRLAGLKVSMLLPGHNDILPLVPDGYILRTAQQWERYLK
jgi:glyoxylase-like metal-dependent hydrolase (beta-lactamase superfamily II)